MVREHTGEYTNIDNKYIVEITFVQTSIFFVWIFLKQHEDEQAR